MIFGYPDGSFAQLTTAVRTSTPQEATMIGTEGSIRLHSSWWRGSRLTLTKSDGKKEELDLDMVGNGYNYEAAEVGRCLREGLLESPSMTHAETVAIMQTLDAVRARTGITYPSET